MTTLIGRGRRVYARLKREAAINILSQAVMLLGHFSENNYQFLGNVFNRIANTEQQRMLAAWISNWLSAGNPGAAYFTRILNGIHPNVRKKYIAQFVVNAFFRNVWGCSSFREENGFNPPAFILISPTMRCNYRCTGCYAANYTRKDDMPPEVFDRVLSEAEEIGCRHFVILGGEPFIYRPLLDVFEKHRDSTFQVYTNGSLINEAMAQKLVELGNVAPQVSIEGFREQTDLRRGKGAFDRAMRAMDNLREKGCIFAFSITVDRSNIDEISSDEFIDFMIEKGAFYGWYFLYMPVGQAPSLDYMPTPEERDKLRIAVNHIRKTKPILIADFWNDAPLIGGCIAGGRIYLHINHKGDVEPCIFCHYATHNINQVSLVEALKSPFFAGIRGMQPFSYNTLRPCPIIDQPGIMRMALKEWGAYPTHEGAEATFTGEIASGLDRYATEIEELYDSIWDEEYESWAGKWMEMMEYAEGRIDTKRAEYYQKAGKRPSAPSSGN